MPARQFRGWHRALRQRKDKIDDRTRQNPAYRSTLFMIIGCKDSFAPLGYFSQTEAVAMIYRLIHVDKIMAYADTPLF